MDIVLRDYQQETLDMLPQTRQGRFLICLATGLGKTVLFSQLSTSGRMLILSHRDELVRQPKKYFNCSFGIEKSEESSNGEKVVSASVLSIVNRLDKFSPEDFDIIIVDEAHHCAALTYKTIISYFKPRLLLGFTATPKRNDGIRLNDVFDEILVYKSLKWGIENGWLSDIKALKINIGYDLSRVSTAMGDYIESQLSEAMQGTGKAIGQIYKDYARGATLIFGSSVAHCQEIAEYIPDAVVVTAKTKNRDEIIDRFTKREIPCLINCMIFTEGTDIPLVETVVVARPTQNEPLYEQLVGRGVRLHAKKPYLLLIDCCGKVSFSECSFPSLLGLDSELLKNEIKTPVDILEVEEMLIEESNKPESIIKNVEQLKLWAKKEKYNLRNINFFKKPNGDLILNLPKNNTGKKLFRIPAPTVLGSVYINDIKYDFQYLIDNLRKILERDYSDFKHIWDLQVVNRWAKKEASFKQKRLLDRMKINYSSINNLNKMQAGLLINHKILK